MVTFTIKDFKSTHFEYKKLDPIHGSPDIDSLLTLFRQVKRNAQSVPTTLGGGQMGYLGLVLTEEEYKKIPHTVKFSRPSDPGPFIPTTTLPRTSKRLCNTSTQDQDDTMTSEEQTTAADIAVQKATHDEQIRIYLECQEIEQALRSQIVEAVEPDYIDTLRDSTSDMIVKSIPEIITYLQQTYGQLTIEEMVDKEQELREMLYDPVKLVANVFSAVDHFRDLCILTQNTKTDAQLMQLAYMIFNKTKMFTDALKKWNTNTTQTYDEFKKYMQEEHKALRKVGVLSVAASKLYNANMMADLEAKSHRWKADVKTEIKAELQNTIHAAIASLKDNDDDQTHQINNTSNTMFAKFYDMVDKLNEKIDEISSTTTLCQDTTINPKTSQPWKRYCWSYGCCPHHGKNCPAKKQGHKNEATFCNRLGGSNKNCHPIRD